MSERAAPLTPLSEALSAEAIAFLRAGYDRASHLAMSSETMVRVCPSYGPWIAGFTETLYASKPLSPRDQELALICLLGVRAPGLSLANHVYAALMEGVTLAELQQLLSLIGGYHGMEMLSRCLLVLNRTLLALKQLAADGTNDGRAVLSAIVQQFANVAL